MPVGRHGRPSTTLVSSNRKPTENQTDLQRDQKTAFIDTYLWDYNLLPVRVSAQGITLSRYFSQILLFEHHLIVF